METTEIEKIGTVIRQETEEVNSFISEEDIINFRLDFANSFKAKIEHLNSGYLKLFKPLSELTWVSNKNTSKSDLELLEELIREIDLFNLKWTKAWIKINNSKDPILISVCKDSLLDLRINIRTMRDYSNTIRSTFFNTNRVLSSETFNRLKTINF